MFFKYDIFIKNYTLKAYYKNKFKELNNSQFSCLELYAYTTCSWWRTFSPTTPPPPGERFLLLSITAGTAGHGHDDLPLHARADLFPSTTHCARVSPTPVLPLRLSVQVIRCHQKFEGQFGLNLKLWYFLGGVHVFVLVMKVLYDLF